MIKKNHLFDLGLKTKIFSTIHGCVYRQTMHTTSIQPKLGSGGIKMNDCLHRTKMFQLPTKYTGA